MHCKECDALFSEYRLATERYSGLAGMGTDIPEFEKMRNEVAKARLNCRLARNALSTHLEAHLRRRARPYQHQHSTARTAFPRRTVAWSSRKKAGNTPTPEIVMEGVVGGGETGLVFATPWRCGL